MEKIYIVLVTWNGERDVPLFCDSLKNSIQPGCAQLIVVDNNSQDSTLEIISKKIPEAIIIKNNSNTGFAIGSNQGMRYALDHGAEYIMLANQDLVFEKVWLEPLKNTLDTNTRIAAVQPLVMLYPDKEKINSCGNVLHYLGFGYTRGYLQKWGQTPFLKEKLGSDPIFECKNLEEIGAFSGSAVLLRASILKEVGLLDEHYFMYHEDADLGWRFRLAGYTCVICTDSVVYHHYEFSRSILKFYYMERNRYLMMLKNYSLHTLLLLAPFFFFWELGMIFYSLFGFLFMKKTIGFPEKVKGYVYFGSIKNWKALLKERKRVQTMRKIPDREIIKLSTPVIEFQDLESPIITYIANPLSRAYWFLIKRLI